MGRELDGIDEFLRWKLRARERRLRETLDHLHHESQAVRIEVIVAVDVDQVFSAGEVERLVAIGVFADVGLVADGAQPRIAEASDDLPGPVRRAVVANEQLEVHKALREDARDGLADEVLGVVGDHRDRDERIVVAARTRHVSPPAAPTRCHAGSDCRRPPR